MVTRPKLRLARYLVPVIIVLAIIFSIRQCGNQEKPSGHPRDYAAIAKEGILRVATDISHQRTERLSAPHLSHHAQQASARATERKRRKRLTLYP